MDFFKKIHKQAAEAQKRWDEIDKRAEEVKEVLNGSDMDRDEFVKKVGELLVMFVDHLRPMNKYKTDEMEKSLKEALDLLTKE